MKLPLPIYRALAVLKAEGAMSLGGIADAMDVEEVKAQRVIIALVEVGWAWEQILFDGSSEFCISDPGGEVLAARPKDVTADGLAVLLPPRFKAAERYEQQDLL